LTRNLNIMLASVQNITLDGCDTITSSDQIELRTAALLEIRTNAAFAMNKIMNLICLKSNNIRSVNIIIDKQIGLGVEANNVKVVIYKESFQVFRFEELDDIYPIEDYEDDIPIDQTAESKYIVNHERAILLEIFKNLSSKDSLKIELLQSVGSHIPDFIKFVINDKEEHLYETSVQTPKDFNLTHADDIPLAENISTDELFKAHTILKNKKKLKFYPCINPHTKQKSMVLESVSINRHNIGNKFYVDCLYKGDDAQHNGIIIDIENLLPFKTLKNLSSNVSLFVNNVTSELVILSKFPKGQKKKAASKYYNDVDLLTSTTATTKSPKASDEMIHSDTTSTATSITKPKKYLRKKSLTSKFDAYKPIGELAVRLHIVN